MNEKLTYNWLEIPDSISPLKLIPWFENPIENKVYDYIDAMNETYDIEYTFPPIKGYPIQITEDDVWTELITGIDQDIRYITEEDINDIFWVVTDWFHRSVAAITTGKKYIDVELDRNSITNQDELNKYDSFI